MVACLDSNSFSNIIVDVDLNLILNEKEKSGDVYGKDPMLKIVDNFILAWELIEFKPKRGRFTWSNNRLGASHISTRLDHFLVQSSLLSGKKVISSSILPKITSDHKSILLQIEDEEYLGPIPFQSVVERQRWIFENCNYGLGYSSCWIPKFCLGEEAHKY